MRPIHGLQRHQHVKQGAPRVGEDALLQDYHGVPDVPVPEVHPHCRPHRLLATTTFDWVGPRSRPRWTRHPVGSGIFIPITRVCPAFLAMLFWVWRCFTSENFASSFPHYGHRTPSRCLSLKLVPDPVILCVYASSACTPTSRKGQHNIPTVFWTCNLFYFLLLLFGLLVQSALYHLEIFIFRLFVAQ